MALTINHNLMAMNASRNLGSHYHELGTSTRRLSSGLRVGTAADDAAGLAIRELMRADISSLYQGIRNANDAISMIQVADGALQVIDEKLIRMKELATQAATGTYNDDQRLIIDSEFQAMRAEIDRISQSTDFNGIKLLDGSLSGTHSGLKLNSTGSAKIHFGSGNDCAEDYYYISVKKSSFESLINNTVEKSLIVSSHLVAGGDNIELYTPTATTLSNGNIAISYQESFSSTASFKIMDENGVFLTNEIDITNSGDYITIGSSGDSFMAVWGDLLNGELHGRIYDNNGESVSGDILISNNFSANQPQVQGFDDGSYLVTWSEPDASNSGVFARRYDSTGAPVAAAFQVNQQTTNFQQDSEIVKLDDESYVIAFDSDFNVGPSTAEHVYARMYAADDTPTTNEFIVPDNPNTNTQRAAGAPTNDGGYVLVWEDSYSIQGQRFDSVGNEVGSQFIVYEDVHYQSRPDIVRLSDGGFMISWKSAEDGTPIMGRQYDADMKPIGSAFFLEEQSDDWSEETSMASLSDNGFVITYKENDPADNRYKIYANIYRYDYAIQTQESAQEMLIGLDHAIVEKDKIRANLGATQNRLENTITNLSIQAENLQASESRISDVDVAKEMTEFVSRQILTQAATAMLAQANSLPRMAIQLIQG